MQTFITDHNLLISARNLDTRRLGKQRVEALQIADCLIVKESRWKNHPAVKMWKGYEYFLVVYYIESLFIEWEINRSFKNEKCLAKYKDLKYKLKVLKSFTSIKIDKPHWLTNEFIESHRSNLIRKNPEYYKKIFPNTKEGLEYIWPVCSVCSV